MSEYTSNSSAKTFRIEGEIPVVDITQPRFIKIDNGEFNVTFSSATLDNLLTSKGITMAAKNEALAAILKFQAEVNGVDKTTTHVGSTDPVGAIHSVLHGIFGDKLISAEEVEGLFTKKQE